MSRQRRYVSAHNQKIQAAKDWLAKNLPAGGSANIPDWVNQYAMEKPRTAQSYSDWYKGYGGRENLEALADLSKYLDIDQLSQQDSMSQFVPISEFKGGRTVLR